MTVLRDLQSLVRVSRAKPKPKALFCRCGGAVFLAGEPAPRYTCEACGDKTATLMALEAK